MAEIPIYAARRIAENYGYDQVAILARKTGEGPDAGEHITTYGVSRVHCDVAALMGKRLRVIAAWPSKEDRTLLDELLDDLVSGTFGYEDYDRRSAQVGALHRLLKG